VASVCPGMDDGRFQRKADIVQRWREMARSRMTLNGHRQGPNVGLMVRAADRPIQNEKSSLWGHQRPLFELNQYSEYEPVFDYVVDRDPMIADCKRAIAQQTRWMGRVYRRVRSIRSIVFAAYRNKFLSPKSKTAGLADW